MKFKSFPILLLLLISISVFSQDVITKMDGETIDCKVLTIEPALIEYKKQSNPSGPSYKIEISKIEKIVFANGNVETFDEIEKEKSFQGTKDFLEKQISAHGFEEDTFNKPYRANFEGKYLRLTVHRRNGNATNYSFLYDFSNVYKFQRVSVRSDKMAFINIFVSIITNESKMKFDKHKLIMRVDDPVIAESILDALKNLNKFLLDEKKKGL